MNASKIDIQVDRLTLHGIDARHRGEITGALARELERLISTGGLPRHWTGGDVDSPRVAIKAGASPMTMGQTLARTIYRGGK
ncbi:MAG: hypothetical protein MJE77_20350 [Proteobacteria bacterium]|nr:hypothetical protein [Pseudomonadota bacterium]